MPGMKSRSIKPSNGTIASMNHALCRLGHVGVRDASKKQCKVHGNGVLSFGGRMNGWLEAASLQTLVHRATVSPTYHLVCAHMLTCSQRVRCQPRSKVCLSVSAAG